MYDQVFGEIKYEHGWTKIEYVPFLDQMCRVEIFIKVYYGRNILDKQYDAYKYFIENHETINSKLPQVITAYINNNKKEITSNYLNIDNKKISDIIRPKTLLFNRDGSVVFLCDVPWDEEHGIGIQIYPEYKIDIQDNFI